MISKANTLFVIDCVPDSSWQRRYECHATLGRSSVFCFQYSSIRFDSIKTVFATATQYYAYMM